MLKNFYDSNPKYFASLLTQVGQIAHEHNCWVRLRKVWYTPMEFSQKYRHSNPVNYAEAEILNPMEAIRAGRLLIEQMILDKKPVDAILSSIDRLNVFTDKLLKEGYQERHDQIKQVPWRGQM